MKWIANHRFVVLKPQTFMPPQLLHLKHEEMHPLLNVNFKYEQQDQMVPVLSHCCKLKAPKFTIVDRNFRDKMKKKRVQLTL